MFDSNSLFSRFGVARDRALGAFTSSGLPTCREAEAYTSYLAEVPDPGAALAQWESWIGDELLRPALKGTTPEEIRRLLYLMGSSQALVNCLRGAGAVWLDLFRSTLGTGRRSPKDYVDEVEAQFPGSFEDLGRQLRRIRQREYLRIGLADLEGESPVEETVAELTALADGLTDVAVRWGNRHLREFYGELWGEPSAPGKRRTANAMVVFGMGKLGGGELNFSSDIDLVYLYDQDGQDSTGGSRGRIDPREYFTKLAEIVTKALHEITADGFVFRVDLRLRPDGINGPLANSLSNSLLYYESYGQTWERTALVQARPIAGDLNLGERFLREVQPFVFRRYLDFSTVADMKAMKSRVESELGVEAGRLNVKLGRGGIREIEFLSQVLQLIHGGRDSRLRGRGTIRGLKRMVDLGYLAGDDGEILLQAYKFLRQVEHKIQIESQRQTHAIPEGALAQEALARRLGYRGDDSVAQMWVDLDQHRGRVRAAFERLFYEPGVERQRTVDPATSDLLARIDQRDTAIEQLRAMGFARPEESYASILLLRDGPEWAPARPKRKQALYDLSPALLTSVLRTVDPDLALRNLADFVSAIGARTSFLALLQENPATLSMLINLFGGSQYLANWFIRHPELLDSLVRADLVKLRRSVDDIEDELNESLDLCGDTEEQLDMIRRLRNQEFLRIGIHDLQGGLSLQEVCGELSNLADACLRASLRLALKDVSTKLKIKRQPGKCVVLAMGKLGSRELNYNSDLDLIFVYQESAKKGPGPVSAQEFFSRVAQRLMMILQTVTREGIAYRIDTRLRPSGNKGPLVSTFQGFQEYHAKQAQLWERQALIKARAVAGDATLNRQVQSVVERFVYRAPLTSTDVAEIRRVRKRMEDELARESHERINIKTGRGGLIDIEFLTQMLQMHFGSTNPSVRVAATLEALAALTAAGAMPQADYQLLHDGLLFIRRVEHTLRLLHDRPVEEIDLKDDALRAVAKRLALAGDSKGFWDAWHEHRESIRGCYDRWFAQAESGFH